MHKFYETDNRWDSDKKSSGKYRTVDKESIGVIN